MPRSTKREVTEEVVATVVETPVETTKRSKKSKKDRKSKKSKKDRKSKKERKSKKAKTETTVPVETETTATTTTATTVDTKTDTTATTVDTKTDTTDTTAATTTATTVDTKTDTTATTATVDTKVQTNTYGLDTTFRSSTDTLLKNVLETVQVRIAADKKLLTFLREINRQVLRERKETDKLLKKLSKSQRKRSSGNKAPGGFTKPTPISQPMCDFLGVEFGTEMPRTEVTRCINRYVKDNNLQNPENKKQILADNKLTALLFLKEGDELTYFNLQRFMKFHFLKKDKETGVVSDFAPPS